MLITQRDLARVVRDVGIDRIMDETIASLADAFASPGGAEVRQRGGFTLRNRRDGVLEWMPSMRPGETVTLKMVAYNPENPRLHGLPTIMASNSVYDCATGALTAIVDGTFATAVRTGAASAVASQHLADPDSSVLGMVGCGAQAVTQIHALARVLPLKRVLAVDPDEAAWRSLGQRVAFTGLPVEPATLREIEEQADVICTATSVPAGEGPVIAGDLQRLKSHVHINAVGSDLPGKTELPLPLLEAAVVCPDYVPQAVVEGECQQLLRDAVGPTLPEVVERGLGPSLRERITVFDSTGFALEDQIVTEIIIDHARRLGVGTQLPLFTGTDDALDPYRFATQAGSGTDDVSRRRLLSA